MESVLHIAAATERRNLLARPASNTNDTSPFFLSLAVFPGMPAAPGMQCQGEDRSIYRRGARRWRKLYKVNGHIFQAKRFNRVSE